MKVGRLGLLSSVENLLAEGADPTLQDYLGNTIMHFSVENGHQAIIDALLIHPKGCETLIIMNKALQTPRTIAILKGYNPITLFPELPRAASMKEEADVKALLDEGAPIGESDSWGHTALFLAAASNYKEIVALLLKRGANPVLTDRLGNTPLHKAAYLGHTAIVQLLLADPRGREAQFILNKEGWTPLAIALAKNFSAMSSLFCNDYFSRVFVHVKLLTQVSGIQGFMTYGPIVTTFDSFFPQIICQTFSQVVEEPLKKAFLDASEELCSPKSIVSRIKANELVIVTPGWYKHVIALVFYRQLFGICNRAHKKTMLCFEIEPESMTEAVMTTIKNSYYRLSSAQGLNYFYHVLPETLKAKEACPHFEIVSHKRQNKENCAASAVKAAARLARLFLGHYREDIALDVHAIKAESKADSYRLRAYCEELAKTSIAERHLSFTSVLALSREKRTRTLQVKDVCVTERQHSS